MTVVCSVPWPLKRSEAIKGDLELLQTFLFSRACSNENNTISYDMRFAHSRSRFVTKQGHFQPRFYSEPGQLSAATWNSVELAGDLPSFTYKLL